MEAGAEQTYAPLSTEQIKPAVSMHTHITWPGWKKKTLSHIDKLDDVCVHIHKFDLLMMKLCSSSSISSQHETFFLFLDSSTQIYLNLDYFNQWRTIWKQNGVNIFSSRRWFWSVVICTQTTDRWNYLAAFWFWFLFLQFRNYLSFGFIFLDSMEQHLYLPLSLFYLLCTLILFIYFLFL